MSLEAPDSTTRQKRGSRGTWRRTDQPQSQRSMGSAETVTTCQGRIRISDLAEKSEQLQGASEVDSVYKKTLKDQNTSLYIYIYRDMTPERKTNLNTLQLDDMDSQLSILSGAIKNNDDSLNINPRPLALFPCHVALPGPSQVDNCEGQLTRDMADKGCQDTTRDLFPFGKKIKGTFFQRKNCHHPIPNCPKLNEF